MILNDLVTQLDGIRLLYSNIDKRTLYTRHNKEVTSRFPELDFDLPKGVILDGEMIQTGSDSKPDFEQLMSRFQVQNAWKTKRLAESEPVTFCAFDVLYY